SGVGAPPAGSSARRAPLLSTATSCCAAAGTQSQAARTSERVRFARCGTTGVRREFYPAPASPSLHRVDPSLLERGEIDVAERHRVRRILDLRRLPEQPQLRGALAAPLDDRRGTEPDVLGGGGAQVVQVGPR